LALSVLPGVFGRGFGDVKQVATRVGYAGAEAHAKAPQAQRVEDLHEHAAGEDGVLHQVPILKGLQQCQSMGRSAGRRAVPGRSLPQLAFELGRDEVTDRALAGGQDEIDLFSPGDG
jgi:hypothetical protein